MSDSKIIATGKRISIGFARSLYGLFYENIDGAFSSFFKGKQTFFAKKNQKISRLLCYTMPTVLHWMQQKLKNQRKCIAYKTLQWKIYKICFKKTSPFWNHSYCSFRKSLMSLSYYQKARAKAIKNIFTNSCCRSRLKVVIRIVFGM